MNRTKLAICISFFVAGNLWIHQKIDAGRPGSGAGLESHLSWIDRSTNLHIAVAMGSLMLILICAVVFHVRKARANY